VKIPLHIPTLFARVVLAYVLALPIMAGMVASRSGGTTLVVTMSTTVPSVIQVFYNTGAGFTPAQSAILPTFASAEPLEYRMPIPPGTYFHIRIDPGTTPGHFVIRRVVMQSADGSKTTALALDDIIPLIQMTEVERAPRRLVVDAVPGAYDPQLLYQPAKPLQVPIEERIPGGTLRRLALVWLGALALVFALEALMRLAGDGPARALAELARVAQARATLAVIAAALIGTVVAMYPVIFLGRSLMSPNNGILNMLYDGLPGVPFSNDLQVEDNRFADTSAGLYAFVPYSNVQREAIRTGEWPLWNRYNAGGRPLWGQGQTFFLDPLHWPTLLTPDPALGWDIKFVIHRLVFAIGVGLVALMITGAWLPAALAAAAAPFVGVFSYRLNHPGAFALTYAPWALMAWLLLARSMTGIARARAALLMTVASSLVLFGSPPKEGISSLLAVCVAGAWMLLASPGGWRLRAHRLIAAVAAGVLVILVTAPHWWIFLDTLKLAATNYDVPYAQVGGIPEALALVLSPLTPGPVLAGVHALAFVLVLAALTSPRGLVRTPAVFGCALAATACLCVAFGIIPVRWLLKTPFIANIGHLQDTFVAAATPLVLVVAAWGALVLRQAGKVRAIVVTLLVVAASWWLESGVLARSSNNAFEPWAAGFLLFLAAMFPLVFPLGRAVGLRTMTVAAAVVALVIPGGLHASSGVRQIDAVIMQPRLRVALDANSAAVDTLHRVATEPTRVFGTESYLFAGSQALYELEGLGGPDALAIRKYDELVNAAGIWRSDWLTRVGLHDVPRLAPLLDLVNARFLLTGEVVPVGFDEVPVSGKDRLRIGRRVTAWPRAFFVTGVSQYLDPADLLRKVASAGRPFAAIQTGDNQAIAVTRELANPSDTVTPARDYRLTVNSTKFVVPAGGPGIVVLSETYLPNDFVVTLNGQQVPYFRVNHIFKGIVIPSAGTWDVVFEYRPAHWRTSLALAGIGLVGLLALGVTARPRRAVVTGGEIAPPAISPEPPAPPPDHRATLDRLLQARSSTDSPAQIFDGVTDDFWFWAFTEGYRTDPRLAEILPAFPSEEVQFNFTGAAWDDTMRQAFQFYTLVQHIVRVHGAQPPSSVLEFGCGWGRIIRLFLRDVPPGQLWGVDCLSTAIDICKATNTYCRFELVDPLPPSTLPAASFDLVYAYSVFSHLSEDAHLQWLKEFTRILRPGGLIVVTTRPRDFILECAELRAQQENRTWAASAVLAFPDTEDSLARYDRGEFLYEPIGGGDVLDRSIFGETCIPRTYVTKVWSQYVEVVDYIDDPAVCPQNVIVARKRG
jgi:SAM-dependent methyltransferase